MERNTLARLAFLVTGSIVTSFVPLVASMFYDPPKGIGVLLLIAGISIAWGVIAIMYCIDVVTKGRLVVGIVMLALGLAPFPFGIMGYMCFVALSGATVD